MALTEKQSRFVEAYVLEPNGTKAALASGSSKQCAAVDANRMLKNAKVLAAIDARRLELQAKTGITAEMVIAELARIGFAKVSDLVSWGSKEIAIGYDAEGKRLSPQDIGDAVLVCREMAPFVEAIDSEDLPESVRAAVSEIALTPQGLKIKMHPKAPALVKLGETLGIFRHETAPRGAKPGQGKKEAAQEAAQTAGVDTDWGDDLGAMN